MGQKIVMRANYKKIILAVSFAAVIIAVRILGIDKCLNLETYNAYKEQITLFIGNHYFPAVLIYIALYVFVTSFSLPGAAVLTLSGGFLFGMAGILYVNIGATAGALNAFLAARYLIGDSVQKRYGGRMNAFNKEIDENGYSYLLTLRLIPLFPFFLINIFTGLTKIPMATFIWTTSLGIIPGSFVYIYTGSRLKDIKCINDIMSWQILSAFILLGLLAIIPVIIKKRNKKSDS